MAGVRHGVALAVLLVWSTGARAEGEGEAEPAPETDFAGSKDHPLFTRMPGFFIEAYAASDFDSFSFEACPADRSEITQVPVEGRKAEISYRLKAGQKELSSLQLVRNYENAARKAGFVKTCENLDPGFRQLHLKLLKDGREAWVLVESGGGEGYRLVIVEKGELKQDVTARSLLDALNKDGRVALYINFDTGKATLRPDAGAVIAEVLKLLQANAELKLGIEGHTDNQGAAKSNKKLSEDRAKAVLASLVSQGIDAKRLTSAGLGQEKPIADNGAEAGRAKNRRVGP